MGEDVMGAAEAAGAGGVENEDAGPTGAGRVGPGGTRVTVRAPDAESLTAVRAVPSIMRSSASWAENSPRTVVVQIPCTTSVGKTNGRPDWTEKRRSERSAASAGRS